jgi:DNA polymerase-1
MFEDSGNGHKPGTKAVRAMLRPWIAPEPPPDPYRITAVDASFKRLLAYAKTLKQAAPDTPHLEQLASEGVKNTILEPPSQAELISFAAAAALLGGGSPLALDLETYGENIKEEDAALDPAKGEIGLISLNMESSEPMLVWHKRDPVDPAALAKLLQDRQLIVHNARFDLKWLLAKFALLPSNLFCTLTAARLLSNGSKLSNKLGDVLVRTLGINLPKDQGASDWGGMFLVQGQLAYAANDVRHLHALKDRQLEQLRESGLEKVFELECALIPMVLRMETAGFGIDKPKLEQIRDEAAQAAEIARAELVKFFREQCLAEGAIDQTMLFAGELGKPCGDKINIDSPIQLKEALARAGIHVESTKEETLRALDHPVADQILSYRAIEMRRRQATALLEAVSPDGRIHATFNPLGTETGRFTSKEPNLQQISRGVMRTAFVAPPGHKLIIADYSQIELRAAAYLSGEEAMLAAFREGKDLHVQTAAVVLKKKKPEEVTKDDRQTAKPVNFGLIYGQKAAGLRVQARTDYGVIMSERQAEAIQSRFFAHYQGLAAWHRKADALAPYTKEGRTVLGRRRLTNEDDTNWGRFQLLINFPVQGSCADGLKLAMVRLAKELPPSTRMIATVHDELVLEAPEAIAEEIKVLTTKVMVEEMSRLFPGLPIEVEAKICNNWGEK